MIIVSLYIAILILLSLYGLHRYWILYLYWRHYKKAPPRPEPPTPAEWPRVTIQLPLYNEYYVVERLLDAACAMDYPRERLEIQVLDDSTDDTRHRAARKAEAKHAERFNIQYVHRSHRNGFKAGALAEGLPCATGEFIAIFDADFLPPKDFLQKTIPHFFDPGIAMVQTRWGHLNADYSLLTRLQSLFLDGHFMLEHTARNRSGAFFNFNGTAGVWRRCAIEDAGGWSDDTLTEDLDLSYRAQMRGWKFLFLPEVVCPAELPVDMGAFRSQQHRWTKGALQVARKVLPVIWKSRLPFLVKLESTVHLTANVGYALIFLLSILLPPSLYLRRTLAWPALINGMELAAFVLTTISIAIFYIVVRRETRSGCGLCLRDLPALMAFGVGMCVNNARAIGEAFLGVPTEFQRTAKYNIRRTGETWKNKQYRTLGGQNGFLETLMGLYLGLGLVSSFALTSWLSWPFVGLVLFGYVYVGYLSFSHAWQRS